MHPILLQNNFFTIHTFAIFIAIAILTSYYSLIKLAIKNNLKLNFFTQHSWKIILIAVIGGRIMNIILNYQSYFYEISTDAFFNLFAIWDKGINLWSAILAGLVYFHFLCKKSGQDFWKWLDIITPSIIFGLAISHIGAFFEGINYGIETSLPWGVNFESPSIKYAVPIHPTQIYAFLYSIFLAIEITFLNHTEKIAKFKKAGFLGLTGITAYSFFRFLEEFIRGDDVLEIFEIRVPQILAFLAMIFSGTFLYIRYNRPDLIKKILKK